MAKAQSDSREDIWERKREMKVKKRRVGTSNISLATSLCFCVMPSPYVCENCYSSTRLLSRSVHYSVFIILVVGFYGDLKGHRTHSNLVITSVVLLVVFDTLLTKIGIWSLQGLSYYGSY